ncbi:MAG: nicotinate-nucleotide--dimethylbenzimidazole phosphoribosyltransferase [Acidimicrobiales bacterium]
MVAEPAIDGELPADRPFETGFDPGSGSGFGPAELDCLPEPCGRSIAVVAARVADILRPAGALARLDELAVWLAGWQRTTTPSISRPAALIFAGDHGVTADGVSAYPTEVTAAMLEAFRQDRASISAMAKIAGASVDAIDVGVGDPTGNLRIEPAMDRERFEASLRLGRQAVRRLDADLLIIGEMGIGNTTSAAAVTAALLDRSAADVVGSGTGVDRAALANKVRTVDEAVARVREIAADGDGDGDSKDAGHDDRGLPLEILRQLGGTELAAMAGAMVEARRLSLPVLLDGYVTSASALTLHHIDRRLTTHLLAGHRSAEPGHRLVLDALGLEPILDLDFRLGEASGAMAAVPLVKMACTLVNDVPTFAEWFAPPEA